MVDYGHDYPQGIARSLGKVSYAELKSGVIVPEGRDVQTVPLSSMVKAREIAGILKSEIRSGALYHRMSPRCHLPDNRLQGE